MTAEIVLSSLALITSIVSIIISVLTWKSDNKKEWYWNIVVNDIREQICKLEKLNEDIEDNSKKVTEMNRISRILKNDISFLEIEYPKESKEISDYIENQINKIISEMLDDYKTTNYKDTIKLFEIDLYKKLFNIII